jgi:hypothetical protein
MQPSKRSSSKEEIRQEIPTKITSQHFMFPQVCFLWETHEKMKKKEVRDTWGCLMAILLILINLLPFSFSFI